jgi:hypothetical protein
MIQRHNVIICLALLAVLVFAAVAEAGLLCGRRCRTVVRVLATCETVNGGKCYGTGRTCPEAIDNAINNCSEPVLMCVCPSRLIYRKGLFRWRLIGICEEPVCGAREKTALVMARCPTEGGGSCYGYGTTCDEAKANAVANCTKKITGPCTCPTAVKKKHAQCR